jgi:two-component system LytT family response regulator
MSGPVRLLIVDDEPLARASIRALLEDQEGVIVAGECADGPSALAALRAGGVDAVFLDVQMPGMTGFEVLEALDPERLPVVVFVTAYDAYAVRAFDVRSIDYLLKPYTDERFYQALGRAKEACASRDASQANRMIIDLLAELRAGALAPAGEYLERVMIRSTGRVLLVPVAEIDWIEAEGDYARLMAGGKAHLLRETVASLEGRLDPAAFLRIHRSYIVRIDRIRELRPQSNGDYRVYLKDGTQLPLSRTYREQALTVLGRSSL